jgi:hypothetical protein
MNTDQIWDGYGLVADKKFIRSLFDNKNRIDRFSKISLQYFSIYVIIYSYKLAHVLRGGVKWS